MLSLLKKNRKDHQEPLICPIMGLSYLMMEKSKRDFLKQISNLSNTNRKRQPKRRRANFLQEGFSEESSQTIKIRKSSQSLMCLLRQNILRVSSYQLILTTSIGSTQYSLTDLKKTLLELKIKGQINDTIKRCNGYIFQIKAGDD